MEKISYQQFDELYQQVVTGVLRHWTDQMQEEIAVHNFGWRPDQFDHGHYFRVSNLRYYRAYLELLASGRSICDLGGFGGVFPITLAKLGFDVTMTEALQYYGEAFTPLFRHIESQGVRIIDYDPFGDAPTFPDKFDFVSVMAVLEHYPHSLKQFMTNATSLMKPEGSIYLEVPNLAYLPKRVYFMLKGQTPLAPIDHIWRSAVPFIGHHHEFTMPELKMVADLSGLRVASEHYYNYWHGDHADPKNILRRPHHWLAFSLWKSMRALIAVRGVQKDPAAHAARLEREAKALAAG